MLNILSINQFHLLEPGISLSMVLNVSAEGVCVGEFVFVCSRHMGSQGL